MVHGLKTLSKLNDLAIVNKSAKGNYQHLPAHVGLVNSIASECEGYRLFKYPAIAGRMKIYDEDAQGQFVFVECPQESIDLIGKGAYLANFDRWAQDRCKVICEVTQSATE